MATRKFNIGDKVRIAKKYQNRYNCIQGIGVVRDIFIDRNNRTMYSVAFEKKNFIKDFYSYELEKAPTTTHLPIGTNVKLTPETIRNLASIYHNYVDPAQIYTVIEDHGGRYLLDELKWLLFEEDELILEDKKSEPQAKTLQVTLEQAKEMYKAGGCMKKLALALYTETELSDLPRSWEDYCMTQKRQGWPIRANGMVQYWSHDSAAHMIPDMDKTLMPTEGLAEAFVALTQLVMLRQAWVKGWKPNFSMNFASNWTMEYLPNPGKWEIENHCRTNGGPLTFPSKEMAEDFLQTFETLLNQAKILL